MVGVMTYIARDAICRGELCHDINYIYFHNTFMHIISAININVKTFGRD